MLACRPTATLVALLQIQRPTRSAHSFVVRSGRVGGRHTFAEQDENLERELDALVPDPVNEVRPVGDIVA